MTLLEGVSSLSPVYKAAAAGQPPHQAARMLQARASGILMQYAGPLSELLSCLLVITAFEIHTRVLPGKAAETMVRWHVVHVRLSEVSLLDRCWRRT